MQNVSIPKREKQVPKNFLGKLVVILFLTIIYFYAGKLGLSLAFVNPSATSVWPPAGIALAAFLLLGDYIWPAVLVGAFLVNFTTSGSVMSSFTIAIGNTMEGLVAAYLVNHFANGFRAFARAQDVLKFTILAGLFATAISATIGVTSLIWDNLADKSEFIMIWLTWWLGDAIGVLILAPVIILWSTDHIKTPWVSAHTFEAGFMLFTAIVMTMAVFGNESFMGTKNYPLEFLVAPWIVWAAFRFGQRGTVTVTAVIAAVAIEGALRGVGPFARDLPNEGEGLLLLQGFMGTVAITGLIVAALVSERHEIEAALRESNDRLSLSVDELQQHNYKMTLLNDMRDLLQSSSKIPEAYTIISQFSERLFPEEDGAVYMINNSRNIVENVLIWGKHPPEQQEPFGLDDCWALRRGRIHLMNESGLELPCPHLKASAPQAALCIPMMAQSEVMGILHFQRSSAHLDGTSAAPLVITETQLQLAKALADTIALALANLKLRTSLLYQSIRDPLTGLFNRRYLEETLEREISHALRVQRSVGVIMLDIDHFKRFNDTYTHEAGDLLLRELGNFLKQEIRGGDFACRYGGEEFVVIMPEMSLQDGQQTAERLRENIKQLRIQYGTGALENITLSLGVALFPEHGITARAVLHAADEALYEAKHRGRDRVIVSAKVVEDPSA